MKISAAKLTLWGELVFLAVCAVVLVIRLEMKYVALCKPNGIDPKYEITWETLKELGCEIPEALNNVVYGGTQIKGQMQLDL